MNITKITTTVGIGLISLSSFAATTLTVKPGSLQNLMSTVPASEAALVLTGELDARDFETLSNLPANLTSLDMSSLKIVSCNLSSPSREGLYSYDEGQLPSCLFINSTLSDVVLPSNLKIVPQGLFAGSNVKNITVPTGCSEIAEYAFYDCGSLKTVVIPSSVKKIGERAFAKCHSLNELQLPSGVELSGAEIFYQSGIGNLDLKNVGEMADFAASGSNAKNASVGTNAENTVGLFMSSGSLQNIEGTPADIPALYAANTSSLKVSDLVANAQNIGEYAFGSSDFLYMSFYPGLKSIEKGAFANCHSLQSINAKELGSSIPETDEEAFVGIDTSNIILTVAEESVDNWKAHPVWGRFLVTADDSGVDTITSNNGYSIRLDGNNLIIESTGAVGKYSLYSIDGKLIATGNTTDSIITIPTSEWSGAIAVVNVNNGLSSLKKTIVLNK